METQTTAFSLAVAFQFPEKKFVRLKLPDTLDENLLKEFTKGGYTAVTPSAVLAVKTLSRSKHARQCAQLLFWGLPLKCLSCVSHSSPGPVAQLGSSFSSDALSSSPYLHPFLSQPVSSCSLLSCSASVS